MTSRARWLVAAAAVLLATAFVLPLWRIDLLAPQYPEGLGMLIRIDGVEGIKPNDLNNINGLNHYIGMKAIEPDAIPELKYMPWILAGLVAGGIAVAVSARRWALHAWAVLLIALLGVGLWDYWRWGQDYGHDIDREHAIIKIPDMTYSPPLIGRKKLLNFTATSWPAPGGIAMGLAAGLAALAVLESVRVRRRSAALAVVVATACAPVGPREIIDGDACGYCRMEVTDERFGAQVTTSTGKVHVFDSVECLAGYLASMDPATVSGAWVHDVEDPGNWVEVATAGYLVDALLHPPMGRVIAFSSPHAAAESQARLGGSRVSWTAVRSDSGGITSHAAH